MLTEGRNASLFLCQGQMGCQWCEIICSIFVPQDGISCVMRPEVGSTHALWSCQDYFWFNPKWVHDYIYIYIPVFGSKATFSICAFIDHWCLDHLPVLCSFSSGCEPNSFPFCHIVRNYAFHRDAELVCSFVDNVFSSAVKLARPDKLKQSLIISID